VSEYLVNALATVTTNPPSIKIKWDTQLSATSCVIQRKTIDATSWENLPALTDTSSQYTDLNVQSGQAWEYYISRSLPAISGSAANQYICVGIDLPVVDYRGKVILLVESSVASFIQPQVQRLIIDLTCDGWQVLCYHVSSATTVPDVKKIIKTAYFADTAHVKAVFILGHISVPYSGDIAPDGHPDHMGAWPADGYYGDMYGAYTDITVDDVSGSNPANWNVPGDGKFDQSYFPANLVLQVGRVDFYNLPAMQSNNPYTNEVELLINYLNKDHLFRTREFGTLKSAIIDDSFYPALYPEGGWGSFYSLVGSSAMTSQIDLSSSDPGFNTHIFNSNRNNHILFAHADGSGSTSSCGYILSSADFANTNNTYNYVFTTLFGSWFGDWNQQDDLGRVALASQGSILTCAWSGRPYWWFHHLGIGYNIGYSTLINQNNNGLLYNGGGFSQMVHISLLGDPTLRMDIIAPPLNLIDTVISNHVNLHWSPSLDHVLGYYVYKAGRLDTVFTCITDTIITNTNFVDTSIVSGNFIYIVKAVKLEVNNSGTYYNTSRGVLISNIDTISDTPINMCLPLITNAVADTVIPELIPFIMNFNNVFSDPDTWDVLTLSLSMANGTSLPNGWSFDEPTGNLSTASPAIGTYKFVVTATSGQFLFQVNDTFTVTVKENTELFNASSMNTALLVYPNPCTGILHVSGCNFVNGNINFTLYDASGILLINQNYVCTNGNLDFDIDCSVLKEGIYFYDMTSKTQSYHGKMIKINLK